MFFRTLDALAPSVPSADDIIERAEVALVHAPGLGATNLANVFDALERENNGRLMG
jgi:hypothetical protein